MKALYKFDDDDPYIAQTWAICFKRKERCNGLGQVLKLLIVSWVGIKHYEH